MTNPHYHKLLKRLILEDIEINKLECEISQKCITIYETIESFRATTDKHYQELLLSKRELNKWRYTNGKLSNFLSEQIHYNLETRKKVIKLQMQCNDKHHQMVRYQQEKLLYICSMRILKKITNIYINKGVVHLIKGVITNPEGRYMEWMLILGCLKRYTLWEIIDILWGYLEKNLAMKIEE